MIYSDPIENITWNAIEQFCAEKIPESTVIDYKADWPDDLAKTIAAMANTLGGLIIIGVETDAQELPITPITGIEVRSRLELRVFNICEGAIYPPVIPEVIACPNTGGDKAVVVIRVPISRQAHAVEKNTQIYVRTGNRNSPNQLADISKIGWLLGIRGALEVERDALIDRARKRFLPMIRSAMPSDYTMSEYFRDRQWLKMHAVPTYPSKQLLIRDDWTIKRLAEEAVRVGGTKSNDSFPSSIFDGRGRSVLGGYGVASFVEADSATACYHEVGEAGLFFYAERFGGRYPLVSNSHDILWCESLIDRIHAFLCATSNLYRVMNYRGPIELLVSLSGVGGKNEFLYCPSGVEIRIAMNNYWCPDNVIELPISTSTFDLQDNLVDIAASFIAKINDAFGASTHALRARDYLVVRDANIRGKRK